MYGRMRCQLRGGDFVRTHLKSRWVLVVGDSVARMAYAALLALLNGTDPAFGWPTHRVTSGACIEHVIVNGSESWRQPLPHCTMRWRGICRDHGYGTNLQDYCWLDYLVASKSVRLTFLWHTVNRESNLRELATRVLTLQENARRIPDVLLTSTGPWDLMYQHAETCSTSSCCPGVGRLLERLNAVVPWQMEPLETRRPLKVMLGLMRCPACPRPATPANRAGYSCAHFGHRGAKERGTQDCGSQLAKAAGFVYLDSQPLVDELYAEN